MIKTVFTDLDDTLWDTKANNKDAMHELFEIKGWADRLGNFEPWYAAYAAHNDHLWDEYRRGTVTKPELILRRLREPLEPGLGTMSDDELLGLNDLFLDLVGQKDKVVEGAKEMLRELKKDYKIVVLSNGFREVQTNKIKSAGLMEYFDLIVLSEDAGVNKPHKGIFDYAFLLSGARPSESVMVGDSWAADIEGALTAGIPAVWYNPDGEKAKRGSEFLKPVYEVKELGEVPPLLRTLNAFF